jgi:ubiquitin-protein ligase E3 C
MFQSFTGSSRRPRQVNLSGRNTNPFASFPSGRYGPHSHGPQNTLAVAQQERILRQQERERLSAARILQRSWRGYRSRETIRSLWRAEWDVVERRRMGKFLNFESAARCGNMEIHSPVRYDTATDCLSQLRLLLHFLEITNREDTLRLVYFSSSFQRTLEEIPTMATEGEWTTLLMRLAKTTLRIIDARAVSSPAPIDHLLGLVRFLISLIPKQMARIAEQYYSVMMTLTKNITSLSLNANLSVRSLVNSVLALLQPITSETLGAYEWFAKIYLTIPDLVSYLGTIVDLAVSVNYKLLASALDSYVRQMIRNGSPIEDTDTHMWLLAYFIFFHRFALGSTALQQAPDSSFVKVVSSLLNPIVAQVPRRLEVEDVAENEQSQDPFPPFVRDQMVSLVNQNSITGLLSRVRPNYSPREVLSAFDPETSNEAKILATYALTLLRVFPRRGDDIRMWLYLGSTSFVDQVHSQRVLRIPAIKYFWHAARNTNVFSVISQDSTEVLPLLKPIRSEGSKGADPSDPSSCDREQDWTIILLFLELYTFLLKVMDDEEFFSGDVALETLSTRSWTKESALPLRDVRDMTVFLKNLAFTLYWNAADLNDVGPLQDTSGIRNYFSHSAPFPELISIKDLELRSKDSGLSGVTGIPLDYFKGLVTGLLRMIHERE